MRIFSHTDKFGECDDPGKTLDLCVNHVGGNVLRKRLRYQQSAGIRSDPRRYLVQQSSQTVRQPGLVRKERR
jgi:hypothetical protein